MIGSWRSGAWMIGPSWAWFMPPETSWVRGKPGSFYPAKKCVDAIANVHPREPRRRKSIYMSSSGSESCCSNLISKPCVLESLVNRSPSNYPLPLPVDPSACAAGGYTPWLRCLALAFHCPISCPHFPAPYSSRVSRLLIASPDDR